MASDDMAREQALEWAVRTGDPAFGDWDPFLKWLEADPAHAKAYDEVTSAVAQGADLLRSAPANDDAVGGQFDVTLRRGPWLAGGIAAALALLVGVWSLQGGQRDLYTVETALGKTRTVTLDAGTQIKLAGGSAVVLDRKDMHFAKLDHGQALFTVHHDAAHPFEVAVGDARLADIGTVFDVRHDRGGLTVAVAEGAVQVDPDGSDVRVSAGEVLRRRAGSPDYTMARIAPEQVGEWRDGRLAFEAASLDEVAVQLRRATGIDYAADAGTTGLVSGSILVAPLLKDPAAIGPLLGVSVHAEGNSWVIGGR